METKETRGGSNNKRAGKSTRGGFKGRNGRGGRNTQGGRKFKGGDVNITLTVEIVGVGIKGL